MTEFNYKLDGKRLTSVRFAGGREVTAQVSVCNQLVVNKRTITIVPNDARGVVCDGKEKRISDNVPKKIFKTIV
jgi:hypothetical protein